MGREGLGEAAGLAVGAVGADEDGGGDGFGAGGGGDVEFDVRGEFADGGDGFDFAEVGAGVEGLGEAIGVEAGADGHGGDGGSGLDADFALGGVGGGLLEDDFVADAFYNRRYRVTQSAQGFAGQAAGAGLGAREGALVEKEDAAAGAGEVVGGGASGGAGADDEDVVGGWHC